MTSFPAARAVPAAVAALAQGVIQMMWLARLKPVIAVAAALILATAGVAVMGRQQPAPEGAGEQAKTAPAPAAVVVGAATVPNLSGRSGPCQAAARTDRPGVGHAVIPLSQNTQNRQSADSASSSRGQRRLEALHKAGASKAEIIAALEKYITNLKEEEGIATARREAARGHCPLHP